VIAKSGNNFKNFARPLTKPFSRTVCIIPEVVMACDKNNPINPKISSLGKPANKLIPNNTTPSRYVVLEITTNGLRKK